MDAITSNTSAEKQLRAENAELRARLEEAQETLRAIRSGEVEALVVETAEGAQIFTLQGLDAESNRFRGEILAQVSDAVIAVDANERVTYLNAAAERQYCLSPSDALGRPLSETLTQQWPDGQTEAGMRATLLESGEWRGEIIHRLRDGREIAVETRITALREASGAPAGYVAAIRDITAQKLADMRLREQDERQRFAMHAAGAGAWDWDIGSGDIIWSPENYALYDFDPALGMPGYADWESRVHPNDLARTNEMVRDVVEGKVQVFRAEFRVVHRDGRIVWLLGIARVQRDASGKAMRLSGINLDITERKRSEFEVQHVTNLLDTLLTTAPIGFCLLDRDLRYLRINERLAKINGIPAGAHLGRHISEIVPTLVETLHEVTGRILATGEAVLNHEFSGETPFAPGVTRFWCQHWYPVFDGAGDVVCFGAIVEEITERKRAEAELRELANRLSEADQRKDEFLATLAHELRNPLAPIRNGLQLMKMTGGQAANLEQTRSMMDRQLTHMVRLIDDLMDVSRISRGRLVIRKEHVLLAAVVNSAVEASRPLVEQMGQELTITLPQQPLMVDADLTRLAQVFLNLLNNAAKYTDSGGHIQLNVERQGSDAVVTVKDTGVGIAADQLPRIFEMFTQVDGSLEKSQGGLGIGLTLAKRLVEMHGGRVEARSDGPGKGSEFVVRLPLVVETSKPQESNVAEDHAVRSSFRILVVDDNRDSAESLSELLKIMGNDTRTAYDGQESVDAAVEFQPDVILLDIGLPKLNGYEACRRIREQAGGKNVVLIALTGWGQDEDRRRSYVAGFDDHMVKPVDPQALFDVLAGLEVGRKAEP